MCCCPDGCKGKNSGLGGPWDHGKRIRVSLRGILANRLAPQEGEAVVGSGSCLLCLRTLSDRDVILGKVAD